MGAGSAPSMKPDDIAGLVEAEILYAAPRWAHLDIRVGCSSDLMSDILTLDVENAILVTGLANEQAVRTAEMAEISCLLLVRSKAPTERMLELARECGISVMRTSHTMFTCCGRLHAAGLRSAY